VRLQRVLLAVLLAATAFSVIRPVLTHRARYDPATTGFEVSILVTGFMVAQSLASFDRCHSAATARSLDVRVLAGVSASSL